MKKLINWNQNRDACLTRINRLTYRQLIAFDIAQGSCLLDQTLRAVPLTLTLKETLFELSLQFIIVYSLFVLFRQYFIFYFCFAHLYIPIKSWFNLLPSDANKCHEQQFYGRFITQILYQYWLLYMGSFITVECLCLQYMVLFYNYIDKRITF